jgi:hypothetical protein
MKLFTIFYTIFVTKLTFASAVATIDPDSLDIIIPKVKTLGLNEEVTVYNVTLEYNKETFFWNLKGYSDWAVIQDQADAEKTIWNAFSNTFDIPELCESITQTLCVSAVMVGKGPGASIFSLDPKTFIPPTHPLNADWSGSAVDTQCGGSSTLFVLNNTLGKMAGIATTTEQEIFIVSGDIDYLGMKLAASGDFNSDITMSCSFDSSGSVCSGEWTGVWPDDSLSCGGAFSLMRQ